MNANCLNCYATAPYLPNGERPKFCPSCGKSMSLSSIPAYSAPTQTSKKIKRIEYEDEGESSREDISSMTLTIIATPEKTTSISFQDIANMPDFGPINRQAPKIGNALDFVNAEIARKSREVEE